MEKNKFADLSLEELQAKRINAKKVFIVLGCVMGVINLLLVFMIFKTKLYSLFAVVVGSIMTLLPTFINLTQLNEEIKSRQSHN
ncbi:hypothetical protein [Moheibacter sediminis]|uniref:Redox-active disulfide protein 2 n=1 Tax=Moheibacter sediminis TaxID=1434700 RepID=A0A1W2AXI9_9FLAO|nr:hypothetical protein [Moheibacter sediminis]SMC65260.1 hypothetical protein SAMN06296427_105116 [Moheibacter sediminis]